MERRAPREERSLARARPMPEAPPVMAMTLFIVVRDAVVAIVCLGEGVTRRGEGPRL